MRPTTLNGLLIIALSYLMAVGTFLLSGAHGLSAVYLGGTYALTALAALLFSRGVLEFAVGVDRDIAFFVVLRKITDPLLVLVNPIAPGFLLPFALSLYGAFLMFLLKLFLFGDGYLGVPPLFILFYLLIVTML